MLPGVGLVTNVRLLQGAGLVTTGFVTRGRPCYNRLCYKGKALLQQALLQGEGFVTTGFVTRYRLCYRAMSGYVTFSQLLCR